MKSLISFLSIVWCFNVFAILAGPKVEDSVLEDFDHTKDISEIMAGEQAKPQPQPEALQQIRPVARPDNFQVIEPDTGSVGRSEVTDAPANEIKSGTVTEVNDATEVKLVEDPEMLGVLTDALLEDPNVVDTSLTGPNEGSLTDAENAAIAAAVAEALGGVQLDEVSAENEVKPVMTAQEVEAAVLNQGTKPVDVAQTLQALSCQSSFTDIPPFYVSSTTNRVDAYRNGVNAGDPKYNAIENFRNEKGEASKRIARGSIVTVRGENRLELAQKLLKADQEKGWRVPVKVKSANDTYTGLALHKSKFVKKDDEGYIWSKSLGKPGSNQTFVVMEDSYLTPDVESSNLKNKGLKPVTDKDGKYKVNQCCREEMPEPRYATNAKDGSPVKDGNGNPIRIVTEDERGNIIPDKPVLKCEESYFYTVVGGKGDSELDGKEITINHDCFDKAIRPLVDEEKDQFEEMMAFMNENYGVNMSFDSLMFNDFGSAALPMKNVKDTTAVMAGEGINDKFVYYKNYDPHQSDVWGKPTTLCSLYNLTDKFYDACIKVEGRTAQDCKARVGDLGFVTPGEKPNGKDLLGHRSHNNGTCIDLRPFRNDGSYRGLDVGDAGYDRAMNEEFINMAKEMGASPIYLNDSNIKNSSYMKDHDDHMHICFPPSDPVVSKSCSSRRATPARAVASDANAAINSEK
jgi:hypothetical protein